MDRADGSLDPLFAGMQRSPVWPVEAGSSSGPAGVLFDDLHPGPHAVHPLPVSARGDGRPGLFADELAGGAGGNAGGPSLWGDDADGLAAAAAADEALDPTTLFHGARLALEAGRPSEAATGLILALRASPGLAPAILDLLAGRSEPILALVRGDAQRVVGREVEAMRDHATAAGRLGPGAPASRIPDGGPTLETAVQPLGPADSSDASTPPVQEDP
jgi:hypothetical protein